jgi:hypothetical protein
VVSVKEEVVVEEEEEEEEHPQEGQGTLTEMPQQSPMSE